MIVYHGSTIEVSSPDIIHSRKTVDFGPGFYVTPLYEQAANWCNRFRKIVSAPILSTYELDDAVFQNTKSLVFDEYNEEWLDFVAACRKQKDNSDYDIVMGGVANDKVFNTIELYFNGRIDKLEALNRLKYEKPNVQICLRAQETIDQYLKFRGSKAI